MSVTKQIQEAIATKGGDGLRFQTPRRLHYRDRVSFYSDGTLFFERFNYGESAGLVFELHGTWTPDADELAWDTSTCSFVRDGDLPLVLRSYTQEGICFDEKLHTPWNEDAVLKKKRNPFAALQKMFGRK